MLEAGARLGDFKVWGRLGGGGMSDVWLARHVDLTVPVIIKSLKPDLAVAAEERVRRMITEARLMARIPSARVVRALGVGIAGGTPYMVQEYVDGIDLNELDHARRDALGHGLPLWYVCEAAAQIAEGLHAAHQHGVLHRDLKPSNLFGAPELGVKLGDFGVAVAKALGERGACDQSGTLRFMAPEVLRGETTDRRADVYGLGATAYDLRYGDAPFPDPRVWLGSETPRGPRFPRPLYAEEAGFQYVLDHMLGADREDRYRTLAGPARLFAALARSAPRPPAPRRNAHAIVFGGARLTTRAGDLAQAEADGIVTSANWQLHMRSGVGAALRVRGGDEIETEAMAQGEQPLGACVVTGPGRLACRHVLHAVSAWEHASCVGRATQRALLVAERLGLRRLALPALGTGAAGVTLEACAAAMAAAVRLHLALGGTHLEELGFVLYDAPTERVFAEVLEAELLGEVEQVDPGLPHVAASIDAGGASVDAATRLGGASSTPSNTPPRPAGSGDA